MEKSCEEVGIVEGGVVYIASALGRLPLKFYSSATRVRGQAIVSQIQMSSYSISCNVVSEL